jgi:PKD repeat protein
LGGTLNVRDSGGFDAGTYTLFTYSGTLNAGTLTVGTTPNPSFTYAVNTNTSGQVNLVVAWCVLPWANFTAGPTTTGAAPLQVIFTDTSTGTIANVTWTFGDGNSTNFAAPTPTTVTNTYTTGGHYSVTQIVDSASCGISTNGQPNLIWVYTPWEIWQNKYFNCIGCSQAAGNVDADGDGISNTNEFLAGTDPTNSMSALRIISVVRQAGTNIVVTWTAVGGKSYVVQTNAPPTNGSYTNNFADLSAPINVPGNGGDTTAVYTNWAGATNIPSLYYRIRLGP